MATVKKCFINRRLILKLQQISRSEKHNLFTAEVNKIALSVNGSKSIQSIDSTEAYAYGANDEVI